MCALRCTEPLSWVTMTFSTLKRGMENIVIAVDTIKSDTLSVMSGLPCLVSF